MFVSSYKSEDHSPLKVFDKDYNTEWISEGSGSINLLFPSKQSIKTVRLFFNGYSRREFDNICVILKVCIYNITVQSLTSTNQRSDSRNSEQCVTELNGSPFRTRVGSNSVLRFPFNENNVDEVFVALNGDRLVEIQIDFDTPNDSNAELKSRDSIYILDAPFKEPLFCFSVYV